MRPKPRTVLSVLSCVALLAACAASPAPPAPRVIEKRVVEYPPVSGELLACAELPVPSGIRTDRDVGEYVIRLYKAGHECQSKLGAVGRIVRPQ